MPKRKKRTGPGGGAGLLIRTFARLPLADRLHPWLRADKTDMRWLPINEDIRMPENAPLPVDLLNRMIEEASHRVIVDYCGCRKGFGCDEYPVDIGCLLLGDSALEVKNFPVREVGVEEARGHAGRAVTAGLVPVIGKARVDNFIYGVKDRSRLLTVCFCCECCCITRFTANLPLKNLEPIFPRLKGITITVGDGCRGCGKCAGRCYIGAIEVVNGSALIGRYCRACGRCVSACPNEAIEIRIDDPDFLEDAYERIRTYVKYD